MSSEEMKETPDQNTNQESQSKCCGGHHRGEEGHQCCCGQHKDEHGSCSESKEEKEGKAPFDFDNIPDIPLPPPNLISLTTTLAQQAMVSMGIIPHPMTGKPAFMFNQAKHLIDTIVLIFEKSAGNRTEEETKALDSVLHELRMMFVAAQNEKSKRDAAKDN